ncbi:hypothetical protein WA1_11045 [Scytonema hofmannii PCC 7110]|uniref:Uncharacterized protein n=1 Tax=Scytonema hofmannii PCC 7110 TaxID=128403 RepID=A0A139XFX2_9CYAN|nr:hypothetical protein [Scytonema hofmannii]KYC43586.1 hypothetical protein WA1_11045 [Scytonema hofmannii PCC 7110]
MITIAQDRDLINLENNLLRQIAIKENQLKIAQEFNMIYVAETLQKQLLELENQLPESYNLEFQALMSLLDDEDL